MIKTLKDIDLDYLKQKHTRLYYFGLGFIQLKIDETYRLHFYTSELPAINEDIHNHRYDFQSTVLKGSITNRIYNIHEGDTHIIQNESCNPDIKAPALNKPCAVELVAILRRSEGNSYRLTHEHFHTVKVDGECITLLKRSEYKKEFAQIVTPKEQSSVCPFSKKVEDAVLWGIIERMVAC